MNIGKQNDKLRENPKERWRLLNRFIIVKGQSINKTCFFFLLNAFRKKCNDVTVMLNCYQNILWAIMHVAFVDELNVGRICTVKLVYVYFMPNNLVSNCRKTHLVT
jgi:hypothetical protein